MKYIKPYSVYVCFNILSNILSVLFSLFSITMVIPFLGILFGTQEKVSQAQALAFNASSIKDNFYFIISKTINSKGETEALMFICILVLAMFFFKNLFRYLALFFLTPIRNGIIHDIRMDLQKKIISLPLSFIGTKRRGDLTSRMTSDLVEIEWSIMGTLEMVFKDPINILVFLSTLIFISPSLTVFVIILFPLAGILIGYIGKNLKSSSKKGQDKLALIMSIIDENIFGIRIIKAFNAEKFINSKFRKTSEEYKKIMTGVLRKKDLSSPMSELLSTIVMVIVMWFGGQLVLAETATLSPQEFIGYILIFSQIIPPVKSLTTSYYFIQKGSAAAERVYEILNTENTIKNSNNPRNIFKINDTISFNIKSFKYENNDVLKNINFNINKGKKIALVGQSGGGKSTITDLLARFYDVNDGQITIDGINIKDLELDNLRSLMGIVSQESILFNDTIYNNIKIGNLEATEKDIINAAKAAYAHEFILNCEDGYNTNIGNSGEKLSGGEKQRISIARAILKNPQILILDEATSSLDSESEKLVQNALANLMQSRTTLVIAHRLSTIENADSIIVLNNGVITEKGSHKELINKNGDYKKLYDLQSINN
ncbi:ABC transporter ATP-binding protein/permease [Flavobacteriales bacterium]|nr:ABC transporter ATP-binding protein/permease [Flavobacteriales bacterium]